LNPRRIGDVVETSIADVVETSPFRRWINFYSRLVCNPKSTSRRDVDSTYLQHLCAHWEVGLVAPSLTGYHYEACTVSDGARWQDITQLQFLARDSL